MKIAIVHSFYASKSPSGENTTVRAQASALDARGHEVKLIAAHTDIESQSVLYPLRAALSASGLGGRSPEAALSEFNPDIVHVHNLFPNWGLQWVHNWHGPIVATMHNFRPVCANSLLWRDGHDCRLCLDDGAWSAVKHRCYRESAIATVPIAYSTRSRGSHNPLLRTTQTVFALNHNAAKIYNEVSDGPKIEVLPNFVRTSSIEYSDHRTGWLYVGRLTEEKGVGWLLQRWPPNYSLRIIGSGPEANNIRKIIETRQLKNVQLTGQKQPDDVLREISKTRGLIIPSLWSEGIPTVALEALSAGTPLLVSTDCSAHETLTEGSAGVTFTPSSADQSSVEHLLRIVSSRQTEMSHAARSLHGKKFSEESWVLAAEAHYLDAIDRYQGASRKD
ncbi:glycosyltransferase family 4 protein [Rhodococcoides fascians]|uniref:glycosyltransferase family 4 protein n=2 Tax=Bacteria TaxID=2 RepID=UPI0027D90CB2|nr:glycosyltransferase family 4 protein [Rhodococcus fascians]